MIKFKINFNSKKEEVRESYFYFVLQNKLKDNFSFFVKNHKNQIDSFFNENLVNSNSYQDKIKSILNMSDVEVQNLILFKN